MTTTPKKTPPGISEQLPGLSGTQQPPVPTGTPKMQEVRGGSGAILELFPSPFSCDALNISIFHSLLALHVMLSYPSGSAASA